ncbi:MAG: Gfo/Idh/MocA family oxidoreductase [Oscillospiraceae bacterium]|nr:Gfo/Idh/MocA family oxidoreductase [Oscillospiraceae bacterium]
MIRVAIIGTGGIANAHVQAYLRQAGRCAVAALCDIVPGKAEQMKERCGLQNADCYTDWREVLKREDIDLVDVCTPPFVHAQASIAALRSGKNVVCEKPMAASLEECDAMLRARDESGKMLSIIAQNRFRKPIRDLKALLDSGLAGKVRHVQVDSFWWRGHSYYDLWWRGTWEKEGGGCTLNHAVHHIDMLCWMMGLPEQVTSVIANVGHDNAQVEDLSMSILSYLGALGQLTASVVHHGEEQQLIFQCEKARISAPFKVYASLEKPNGFPIRNEELEKELTAFADALPPLPLEGHDGQLEDVLSALEQGRAPAIGGEDGRRTIELITAVFKAGSSGETVRLPLQPSDPFYTAEGILASVPHFYEKTASKADQEGEITLGSSYK